MKRLVTLGGGACVCRRKVEFSDRAIRLEILEESRKGEHGYSGVLWVCFCFKIPLSLAQWRAKAPNEFVHQGQKSDSHMASKSTYEVNADATEQHVFPDLIEDQGLCQILQSPQDIQCNQTTAFEGLMKHQNSWSRPEVQVLNGFGES